MLTSSFTLLLGFVRLSKRGAAPRVPLLLDVERGGDFHREGTKGCLFWGVMTSFPCTVPGSFVSLTEEQRRVYRSFLSSNEVEAIIAATETQYVLPVWCRQPALSG